MTPPGGLDPRIVIVDIDEKSLQAEGHWPWNRHRLKRPVDGLFDRYKVRVLGFDMVFAEKDESADIENIERLLYERGDASFLDTAILAILQQQTLKAGFF